MAGTSVALTEGFELAQRQARAFSQSTLVPEAFRGENWANCLVAMMLADEMGESRLAVMQNLYPVHGRFGWIAAYMISRAKRSGVFEGPLRWTTIGTGDNLAVECWGKLVDGGSDPHVSIKVDLKTAIESGWTTYKKDNKTLTHARWATPVMQEQMLRWRSASWLIRLYAPECMMGLPTKEELEDISDHELVDVTPPPAPKLADFIPAKKPARDTYRMEESAASENVMLYDVTNDAGQVYRCTIDTVEENLMAVLTAAKMEGPILIQSAIDQNQATVDAVFEADNSIGGRLRLELAQLRGILARADGRACEAHGVIDCARCKEQNPADGPSAYPPAGVSPRATVTESPSPEAPTQSPLPEGTSRSLLIAPATLVAGEIDLQTTAENMVAFVNTLTAAEYPLFREMNKPLLAKIRSFWKPGIRAIDAALAAKDKELFQ